VDIYDGNVLIDAINRTRLPQANFPFNPGDELTRAARFAGISIAGNTIAGTTSATAVSVQGLRSIRD